MRLLTEIKEGFMYVDIKAGGVIDDMLAIEEIPIRTGTKSIESEILMADLLGLRELSETLRRELQESER